MITIEKAKALPQAIINHACNYLSIDETSIRIVFAPKVEPIYGVPQNATVLNDDTIVIAEDFIALCCEKGFTMLRDELYRRLRFIAKRREANGNLDWSVAMYDAISFSTALLLLDGNQLPYPKGYDAKIFFKGALNILSNEFGLVGTMFKMPTPPYSGAEFYKIRLSESCSKNISSKYLSEVPFSAKYPKDNEKGTLNNPFDNINEAVDYLKRIEQEAYEQDARMQDIANMQYFYDTDQQHFRILWASPYVAHQKNPYPANSFLMSQMASLNPLNPNDFFFCLKPNLYKHKFLYRGQSDYYEGKPCVPNMFRDMTHNEENYFLDFLIFSQELELLIKSHPIVKMLEQGVEIKHDLFRIRMHYPGLAQHYYNKSMFLDFTSDIDVMKFFATTDYDYKNDEYYPNEDLKKIGVIYYYELKFPEAFQQHKGYALKNIGKQVFLRSGLQSGFLLEMRKGVDLKKDVPEVHAIYFKHDKKISKDIFDESKSGEKYFAEDLLHKAWKDRLKKRFEDRIVSRQAVLLNVSKNKGESESSITNKLSKLGIKVDDFTPAFSDEELKEFYSHIDEWWYNFCDDIHFNDAEDEIYRQEMKDLINNSKYKWAFEYK